MQTTSLALSKQIYAAFPEWKDTDKFHVPTMQPGVNGDPVIQYHVVDHPMPGIRTGYDDEYAFSIPAYDSDYLLDKLPSRIELKQRAGRSWDADYYGGVIKDGSISDTSTYTHADTPAEALGLLVLNLKKAGLL